MKTMDENMFLNIQLCTFIQSELSHFSDWVTLSIEQESISVNIFLSNIFFVKNKNLIL